ncbi:myeloid protein 1-like [Dendronephthya gigantea]|uniref:myeloid protein 1-like n=1 Tax=Dendronephthya gigantea TaxID=151771 RepID=UPI00106C31DF|nr:myeloid protein 1-like [Dendronephthya gigantea]
MFKLLFCIVILAGIAVQENAVEASKFAQLCSSNPFNTVRGCDRKGCGYYGASRGSRSHRGVDITCNPGSTVYAPFDGTIVGRYWPFPNNYHAFNNGLRIQGTGNFKGFRARICFFSPTVYGGTISRGTALGISRRLPYRRITQHVHLQLYRGGKIVDPTPYL